MQHVDEQSDELVSAEVCRIFEINRSTLVRWVRIGKLTPARKLPGRTGPYLFARTHIEDVARAQRSAAS